MSVGLKMVTNMEYTLLRKEITIVDVLRVGIDQLGNAAYFFLITIYINRLAGPPR